MKETRRFLEILLLIFIVLKLCKIIDWSWAWVLAPLWIPASLTAAAMLFVIVYVKFFETEEQRRLRKLSEALDSYADALRRRG